MTQTPTILFFNWCFYHTSFPRLLFYCTFIQSYIYLKYVSSLLDFTNICGFILPTWCLFTIEISPFFSALSPVLYSGVLILLFIFWWVVRQCATTQDYSLDDITHLYFFRKEAMQNKPPMDQFLRLVLGKLTNSIIPLKFSILSISPNPAIQTLNQIWLFVKSSFLFSHNTL